MEKANEDMQALAAREAALASEMQSLQVVPAWQGNAPHQKASGLMRVLTSLHVT